MHLCCAAGCFARWSVRAALAVHVHMQQLKQHVYDLAKAHGKLVQCRQAAACGAAIWTIARMRQRLVLPSIQCHKRLVKSTYHRVFCCARSCRVLCCMLCPQVCRTATQHLSSQSHLSFLEGIHPPTAEAAANKPDDPHSVTGAQPDDKTPSDWIVNANSVDLVWLYFALYKHYHHGK